jgi:4-hydroxy-2-oxoheptanedioate aldolase
LTALTCSSGNWNEVNTLKQNLSAGQTVVGSFVYVPSSKFTEIVGLCGYDFVVIDMPHGPVDFVVAEEMIRAAEIAGTTPLLRVAHNTPHLLLRALDIGAQGLPYTRRETAPTMPAGR